MNSGDFLVKNDVPKVGKITTRALQAGKHLTALRKSISTPKNMFYTLQL